MDGRHGSTGRVPASVKLSVQIPIPPKKEKCFSKKLKYSTELIRQKSKFLSQKTGYFKLTHMILFK
jgi:hypothetical protein